MRGPVCGCVSSVVTTSTPIRRSLAISGMLIAGSDGTRDGSLAFSRRSVMKVGLARAHDVLTAVSSTGATIPAIAEQVPEAATQVRSAIVFAE